MTPGVRLCFLPNEIFAWPDINIRRLASDRYPRPSTPNLPAPAFPFHAPEMWTPDLGSQAVRDSRFFMKPTLVNPVRTLPDSRTKPSTLAKGLHTKDKGLSTIRHCASSVSRQIRYALAPGQVILNATERPELGQPLAGGQAVQDAASSWSRIAACAAIPSAEHQASALDEFREVCRRQYVRRATSVSGEAAVSAEINSQILEIVNVWMRTRYDIPASTLEPQNWLSSSSFPEDQDIGDDLPSISFPFWTPAIHNDMKEGRMSRLVAQPPKFRSGLPDYVLHATLHDNPVVVEVKSPWSLKQARLESFFDVVGAINGKFHYSGPGTVGSLKTSNWMLQQLWAEMYFFNVHMAIVVTGEFITFVYRTGRGELTFSELMSCRDPDMHLATLGFAMAAADCVIDIQEDEDDEEGEDNDEGEDGELAEEDERLASLIELLCPVADRRFPYFNQ